jgi:hypothetical protein
MNIEQALFTLWSGTSGITAVLGSPPRVYPNRAPQNVARPYAVYTFISDNAIGHTGGPSARTHRLMQLDIYATSSIGARNVEEAFRALMNYRTNVVSGGPTIMSAKQGETSAADFGDGLAEGLHRLVLTYSIHHTI